MEKEFMDPNMQHNVRTRLQCGRRCIRRKDAQYAKVILHNKR